jgi:hypothetical protein
MRQHSGFGFPFWVVLLAVLAPIVAMGFNAAVFVRELIGKAGRDGKAKWRYSRNTLAVYVAGFSLLFVIAGPLKHHFPHTCHLMPWSP